jgi:hypothetical protein
MTDTATQSASLRVPAWILWLTWIYVGLFALGVVFQIASIVMGQSLWTTLLGMDVPATQITVLWVLIQLPYIAFVIGAVGVLLRDRDFAWVTVVASWIIVGIQCVQAFLQLFHLRLSIPIGAFLFAAYAIGLMRVLRPPSAGASRVGRGLV